MGAKGSKAEFQELQERSREQEQEQEQVPEPAAQQSKSKNGIAKVMNTFRIGPYNCQLKCVNPNNKSEGFIDMNNNMHILFLIAGGVFAYYYVLKK